MKNKLLLSLLCATAISSTGFASTKWGDSELDALENRVAILELQAQLTAGSVGMRSVSSTGSGASSGASSKASSKTSTPALSRSASVSGVGSTSHDTFGLELETPGNMDRVKAGGKVYDASDLRKTKSGNITRASTTNPNMIRKYNTSGKIIEVIHMIPRGNGDAARFNETKGVLTFTDNNGDTVNRRVSTDFTYDRSAETITFTDGGILNVRTGKYTQPAVAPSAEKTIPGDRGWVAGDGQAKAQFKVGAKAVLATIKLQKAAKLNTAYAKLAADRDLLNEEHRQLEAQLLDLDTKFKAGTPDYEAAKKKLSDTMLALNQEDARLDAITQQLLSEKAIIANFEQEYDDAVANATKQFDEKKGAAYRKAFADVGDTNPDLLKEKILENIILGDTDLLKVPTYRSAEAAHQTEKAKRIPLELERLAAEQDLNKFSDSKSDYLAAKKPLSKRLAALPSELAPLESEISKIEGTKAARKAEFKEEHKTKDEIPNLAGGLALAEAKAKAKAKAKPAAAAAAASTVQGVSNLAPGGGASGDKAAPAATKTRAEIIDGLVSHLGARAQRDQRTALNALDPEAFRKQHGDFIN
ncbi:MAG: hypothetical protein NWS47_01765 [Alphaproteobacteria bacterium]|nr:hypothetical protein [Alphaproteobacteria bacterium]